MEGGRIKEVDNAFLKAASADQPASGCEAGGQRGGQAQCLQWVSCISSLHGKTRAVVGSQQHGCGALQTHRTVHAACIAGELHRSWQRLQALLTAGSTKQQSAHPQAPQPCLPVQFVPQGASRPRLQEAPTRISRQTPWHTSASSFNRQHRIELGRPVTWLQNRGTAL